MKPMDPMKFSQISIPLSGHTSRSRVARYTIISLVVESYVSTGAMMELSSTSSKSIQSLDSRVDLSYRKCGRKPEKQRRNLWRCYVSNICR